MKYCRIWAGVASATLAFSVLAQQSVEVVDLSTSPANSTPVVQTPIYIEDASAVVDASAMIVEENAPNSGDLYFQMQTLQQEVMQLRNVVEQQSRQLQELRELSLQRYIEIDKRLVGGAVAAPMEPVVDGESMPESADGMAVAVISSESQLTKSDLQAYDDAYQLVKNRQYQEAIPEFERFLVEYASSVRRPNAFYWLGQLYMVTNQLEQAVINFKSLRSEFPEHAKTPDGSFKLATLYFKQGDRVSSKSLLDELVASNGGGNPATLQAANAFLRDNF